MLYIDDRFAKHISNLVRNFKNTRTHHYNFSCPICGDSQKKKSKARGYLYPDENRTGLIYKCHNCSCSMGFSTFLKRMFPVIYKEYALEKFKGKQYKDLSSGKIKVTVKSKYKPIKNMSCLRVLKKDHKAVLYAENRKIPEEKFSVLYYAEDFSFAVNSMFNNRYSKLKEKEERLVLPFFDLNGNLIGLQGRTFDKNNKMRYITASADDNVSLVFNADKVKMNETIYVVEGPIDSLFLPNAIAAAGSDLSRIEKVLTTAINNTVYVFDNEKRNREICRTMKGVIDMHRKICIWPDTMKEKDINDMVLNGYTQEEIVDIISNNTYSGITALLKFKQWSRT